MSTTITSTYKPGMGYPKTAVESAYIYRPEAEWTYSHHQSIVHYRDRFYAVWSNGREHEDDVGQRVLISSSSDFHTWTEPKPLVDTTMGGHSELVLTASGFHCHDGNLTAYIGRYEYAEDYLDDRSRTRGDMGHENTGLWAVSTSDGNVWSGLVDMQIPIVPNHGPQKTASGRLIISGNISFPFTDDPSGLAGWTMTGIYPETMRPLFDDSEGFWKAAELRGWPVGLCEGSFFQTGDGVLHMLLRSGTSRLWVTESVDDGVSWSEPRETGFSDNGTKFHFGTLPDGRYYYVGCPDPEPRGVRSPLVLSVSDDGVLFDNHSILGEDEYALKRAGRHKGGQYGYPHTIVHGGYLCIVVSRRKEAVQVLRTPLPTSA